MSNPPLTQYKDDGCRYVEYEFIKKDRFDGRSDLMQEAYSDTDSWALYQAFDSSPHKAQLVRILARIDRGGKADLNTLDDVRHQLAEIDSTAVNDPHDLLTYVTASQAGDALVDGNSTDPSAKIPSSPERKLSRQETKVASKRKVAKDRAKELHGEDFVPSPIYNPIMQQLRGLHSSGQTREAVLVALEGLIAPVRADLTNTQIDLLYTKANELLDGLYRPEEVMRTLLNPPTNGDRSKYKSALYLLLQIQTRYKVGEEFAMPDKDMAGLAGVSKAKGSLDEVKGTLCKLKAIEQIHRGKRSATVRIATTYRRLI